MDNTCPLRGCKCGKSEQGNVAKARQKSVAKARKSQIQSKNIGESWVVLGWFLKKVGAKLEVFCRNLQFLKKGCRAFATVECHWCFNISPYKTTDYTDPPSRKATAGQVSRILIPTAVVGYEILDFEWQRKRLATRNHPSRPAAAGDVACRDGREHGGQTRRTKNT